MQIKLSLLTAAMLFVSSANAIKSQSLLKKNTSFNPVLLALANNYQEGLYLEDYWYSEKLDGIRAIWNGTELMTRKGVPIYAPEWFIKGLPKHVMEGELWAGRGLFSHVQQTVLDHKPNDEAWRKIMFMVFDMPNIIGDYQQRYQLIKQTVKEMNISFIRYVEHYPIVSKEALFLVVDQVTAQQGEGLILRKMTSAYRAGRSNDTLKLKRHDDAEAIVIGYKQGTGKYKDRMGSILVRLDNGVEFYIGSGFTDEMRLSPPPLGSVVTFRFNGLTTEGKPRFARYIRERPLLSN